MKWWALPGLLGLLVIQTTKADNLCLEKNGYHDHTDSGNCSHNNLTEFLASPDAEYIDAFEDNQCCKDNEYTFQDSCSTRKTYQKRVCAAQGQEPYLMPLQANCPKDCKFYPKLTSEELNVTNGVVTLKGEAKKLTHIKDFCAAYQCTDEDEYYDDYEEENEEDEGEKEQEKGGYGLVFHACVCATKEALKSQISEEFPGIKEGKLKQCCPQSFFTHFKDKNKRNELECLADSSENTDLLICEDNQYYKQSNPKEKINGTHYHIEKDGQKTSHDLEDTKHCLGQQFEEHFDSQALIKNSLFHCEPRCAKGMPCLR